MAFRYVMNIVLFCIIVVMSLVICQSMLLTNDFLRVVSPSHGQFSWISWVKSVDSYNSIHYKAWDEIFIHSQTLTPVPHPWALAWWRHQIDAFSALLTLCAGNSPVTGEFPAQRPVTQSYDIFFDLNERLNKQSWGWWFDTPSLPLWRHC